MLRHLRHASSFRSTSALRRPVFDVKGIVARSDEMRESMLRRGADVAALEFVLANRERELALQKQRNELVSQRKKLGPELARVKATELPEKDRLVRTLAQYKTDISTLEHELEALSEQLHDAVDSLPNWLDAGVPQDPHAAEVVEIINGTSEAEVEQRLPRVDYDHKAIGEQLRLMDFATAARIAGSSWYYLVNDGALLEHALVQFALSRARQHGYRMVSPPSIVKAEVVHACGFKPRDQNDEKQVYAIEGEPLALTGTAEIPLGALHSLSVMDGPAKYVGVSRSYRAEAGASGRDTTGLYRVHEFTKVELFHFTDAAAAPRELEQLRELQTSIIRDLGLSARMLNMPTTDLGAPALKKYDCEAWMPGRGSWGELTSCSNCGDYQARRLGIRQKDASGKLTYVHTLNGTAMAVPRVIVAILEQNYDPASQSVSIPPVLRPFMDGKDRISLQ